MELIHVVFKLLLGHVGDTCVFRACTTSATYPYDSWSSTTHLYYKSTWVLSDLLHEGIVAQRVTHAIDVVVQGRLAVSSI